MRGSYAGDGGLGLLGALLGLLPGLVRGEFADALEDEGESLGRLGDLNDHLDERYEVHPDLAELSVEGLQGYIAGRTGYGKIATRWNELGVLNTRGRPWQDQTVRWYYDSGFGAGLLVTHRRDVQCGDPGRCQKPPHYSHLPAEHEAIWTGEEWDGYRERREARRAMSPRSHDPAYPLTGLIRCGECGGYPLNDNAHGQSCYAYHCGARARHAVVHDTVWIRRAVVEARVYDWLIEVREEIDAIAAGTVVVPAPPARRRMWAGSGPLWRRSSPRCR
ncbi:recombinase family protein [Streptomyces virginiae]|uniref:recombinase family protein n=1 Tax=Streptomyces virginiae TaxID=1961 RepID=UPI00343BB733